MKQKTLDAAATSKRTSTAHATPTITTPVTFRTEDTKRDRLDAIAESKGRNRNWVINEALDNYLELHEWQTQHIREGRAASDAGQTLSTEDVRAVMAEHHERRKVGK